jgi:hypothetical protein
VKESLEPRLRASAFVVLRRHGTSDDDLRLDLNEPGKPTLCEILGHRIKISLNDTSAAFLVRGGRWSGRVQDYPSAGSFIADFEAMLERAMTGWR